MISLLAKFENLKQNIMLDDYTSWRIGGPARYFFEPNNLDDLKAFLAELPPQAPILWIGLGSNILIRDGGFNGYVISTLKGLQQIELKENNRVRAEAGVSCAKLARFAARLNFAGGEFLAGIPGTVGGALAMNAGCWGGETWSCVEFVETIDYLGDIHLRKPEDFKIGYREVIKPRDEAFVAGHFLFKEGQKENILAKIRELLDKRAFSQPTGEPSCGSVFRNPPGTHAAKLIEEAGLKGFKIGGAQVSMKHANFIVNTGHATAKEVEQLIEFVSSTVAEKFGIQLIKEVKIIGDY